LTGGDDATGDERSTTFFVVDVGEAAVAAAAAAARARRRPPSVRRPCSASISQASLTGSSVLTLRVAVETLLGDGTGGGS